MEKLLQVKVNFFSGNGWSSARLRSFVRLLGQYRSQSPPVFTSSQQDCTDHVQALKFEHGSSVSIPPRLQIVRANSGGKGSQFPNREIDEEREDQLQVPAPKFSFPTWARWMVGSLLTLVLPFLKLKWGSKLKTIQGEADVVMGGVEKVAEVVEKVAEEAEKVSEEVVESIPDDNGKLKGAALWVEKASKATAHDAQLAQDLIHKVDALEQDMNDLETMVKPIIGKIIIEGGSKGKQ